MNSFGIRQNNGLDLNNIQSLLKAEKRTVALALLLIVAIIAIAISYSSTSFRSQLDTGKNAQLEEITVPVEHVLPGVYLNKQSIYAARTKQMEAFPGILTEKYEPQALAFDAINDEAPWYSEINYYEINKKEPIFAGFSAEAIALTNPLLLISADFRNAIQNKILPISEERQKNTKSLISPIPSKIVWKAKQSRAEAIYELSNYLPLSNEQQRIFPNSGLTFSTVSYNAFDMGFAYIKLDMNSSSNIESPGSHKKASVNYAGLIYAKNGCNYPKGCNVRTSITPPMLIKISKLPAKATFHIWSDSPKDENTAPAFTYSLIFK